MDLAKSGKLLSDLRKSKGMTQKQVADKLGIMPKTVSKWETGKGFPDVSVLTLLASVLGVSEKILLLGDLKRNLKDNGNMKNFKIYVCPDCGSIMHGVGKCEIICCGRPLEAQKSKKPDHDHSLAVKEVENDFYVEFNHEMNKEHFITFVAYVGFDRVLSVHMYPQQEGMVRFPKMFRGRLFFYCSKHGLFEYKM